MHPRATQFSGVDGRAAATAELDRRVERSFTRVVARVALMCTLTGSVLVTAGYIYGRLERLKLPPLERHVPCDVCPETAWFLVGSFPLFSGIALFVLLLLLRLTAPGSSRSDT